MFFGGCNNNGCQWLIWLIIIIILISCCCGNNWNNGCGNNDCGCGC
ncbi:MAG: hypothetical protein ACI4SS_02090 [Clostridia bacterium]